MIRNNWLAVTFANKAKSLRDQGNTIESRRYARIAARHSQQGTGAEISSDELDAIAIVAPKDGNLPYLMRRMDLEGKNK